MMSEKKAQKFYTGKVDKIRASVNRKSKIGNHKSACDLIVAFNLWKAVHVEV